MADQPAGDGDEPAAQGGDHGLAAADAVAAGIALAPCGVVSWCSQPAMLAASSAPYIQAVFTLDVSRGQMPQRGPVLAVAEDVFKEQARLHT